jgi:AraC family transcriptional activator FtrA
MTARRHRVVSVLVDGMTVLEPAVADEFFGLDRSEILGVRWYRHAVCSADGAALRIGDFSVSLDHGLEALARADTVIVPGWCRIDRRAGRDLVEALQRAYRRGARIVSFCTGAFALADAGLLDGRPATTHWAFADEFRSRYPKVALNPAVLYIDDGQVLTSAGAAASIDLSMHLIRRDFGAEIANTVARNLVVPPHRRGGQAQFVDAPLGTQVEAGNALSETLDWAAARLGTPLSVADLAAHAHISPRHFSRQFRASTGTTPHQWLITQRLGLAQRLLESTDQSVDHIAGVAGFGTAAAMRVHFQSAVRTSPASYRHTFRTAAT